MLPISHGTVSVSNAARQFRNEGHRLLARLVDFKKVGSTAVAFLELGDQQISVANEDREVIFQAMNDVNRLWFAHAHSPACGRGPSTALGAGPLSESSIVRMT